MADPATRSLIRLTAEVGQEFEDQADDLLTKVRDDEALHDDTVAEQGHEGAMLTQGLMPGFRNRARPV